ncbi:Si-specific NAD(P)(+) transhydrogenase [Kribbella sp. NPDC000426]|uniref:Si-specific NAD(P)(+) transhydrogenase n=1 Tax=Kribbella sp. NPDC000426 TaxID=3154255 RepID=UPI00332F5BC5
MYDYDLVVIGSGPGGQKAAIAGAKLGKRVAVVERISMLGGVCVNTGTIPSKTLREAVLYLTGMALRDLYGASYRVKSEITIADLMARTQHVVGREVEVVRAQLLRNHVELLHGTASFVDSHTVQVIGTGRGETSTVTAEKIVIATGTRPARPAQIEFDDRHVLDSDAILKLEKVPGSMVVVGAGVIGIEYASMFAALGTRVTVVEKRDRMLEFCDPEVVESLKFHLRDQAVTFRFGEEVERVEVSERGTVTSLASGKRIPAEMVMYSAGRQGVTDALNLEAAGLEADARGRIKVDEHYRTTVEHIYAVGDVIGFPALAANSMDQGRLAAYHAFGEPARELAGFVHIGQAIMGCGGTVDYLVDTVLNYPTLSEAYKVAALDVTNKIRALDAFGTD